MSRAQDQKRQGFFKRAFRKGVLLWTACLLIMLSGCWDLRYLDKLGVVMALGVDEDPSGKQKLQLTVQVVLPQNVAAGSKGGIGGTPVTTFTETGDTLFEAIRKMSAKTSRRLFFSHTQMLVIGEQIAKTGIFPLIDLIERNQDIRTDISVLVTRGVKARELLQLTTQMESIPINQIHEMLEVNQTAYGVNYAVKINDLTRLHGKGKEQAVLPSMRIEGDRANGNKDENVNSIPASAIPVLSTMAVFRNGKLVDYLKPKESRGLSWMRDKMKSTVIKLTCPDSEGDLIVEVQGVTVEHKVKKGERDMPIVQVHLRVTGSIQEIMCPNVNVTDEKVLNQIGMMASKAVKGEVEATIDKLQKKLQVDALGWGKEVYLKQPAIWKRVEGDWAELFPKVESEVICNTIIMGSGVRGKSIVE
ncbi:Ger(x)C family spore germination protein [Paenibacillus sp. LHD-38]|uniref:Ger(x)C family spore germination protein n=1 Tax=Paenibacillus sp. LHD-38 TaxID=3072143 RepID=UPI00280EECFE|nr:Ger(x)C family spore germination protein [Paenibacillus sp. LHD-38]MDQ8734082.1 Ger(x)C family spore germination protein [Paenibacillus sp. LHD-38]